MSETREQTLARLQAQMDAIVKGSEASSTRPDAHHTRKDDAAGLASSPQSFDVLLEEETPKRLSKRNAKGEGDAPKDAEHAFARIVQLASKNEQASLPLKDRLVREGYSAEIAEQAVSRACSCGLVDDGRYGEVLVRSRISQGRGRQGIAAELERLGLSPKDFEEAFCECGDSELDRALEQLERRPPRAKNQRDAAYRRLVGKGYASDVASSASRLWCESR